MRKPRSIRISIANPIEGGASSTSLQLARSQVERGRADWVSPTEIRYREESQVRYERSVLAEVSKDQAFWREVAVQRGGLNVAAIWQPKVDGAGYTVMQARMVAQ